MLIKAYLIIDDLELIIKDYYMEIGKYVDQSNYPGMQKGQHRGFHIEVVAPQNNLLWEEAIKNYSMTPLMQIRLEPAIIGSEKTRIISMYDCHIVHHKVNYHHQDNEPLSEQVHITCGGVEDTWFPGTVYNEHWRVTYPNNGAAAVEEDENEPNFINQHLENIHGEKVSLDEIDVMDEFYLIINTENSTGKTISIDLQDSSKDYEYNGTYMKDDIIKNIKITSDSTKIKLKAVEQQN